MALDVAALGARITHFRDLRDTSLSALAEAAGLAKSYLAKLENGEVENPGLKTLSAIALALDVTVADLLASAEPTRRSNRASLLADSATLDRTMANLPEGLGEFLDVMANKKQPVPPDMIRALALVRFRGRRPKRVEDWQFLYDAMRRSIPQR